MPRSASICSKSIRSVIFEGDVARGPADIAGHINISNTVSFESSLLELRRVENSLYWAGEFVRDPDKTGGTHEKDYKIEVKSQATI